MNESFYSLTEEKQNRIINSAMKIFSQSPYRKASTDDIAAMAGISKGSLFYHFKNKKELYCYLYEYSCKKIYAEIDKNHALEETDFFQRNIKIVQARVAVMIEYPFIFDFALRAYYETDNQIIEAIKFINQGILKDAYVKLNKNIDISKFKNRQDINRAIKMLVWIGEGLIKEKRCQGKIAAKELESEVYEYINILKTGFYKE
ncbi:TetR/AcrR family transcriptional regulator [Clostridium oryzae]|uniref:HTH-type transcriptional regulator AcrR n=1 Tax=Clostridium oryzae TaxID=1450648 RepID=A0A1V4II44_9CLOT|nr:TetR/AcrR family transcriptional regulator [Clostridium oryzae]OPJ59589.1 HTH-type transcriptional regulator AcrR [Clostridium oryzae]